MILPGRQSEAARVRGWRGFTVLEVLVALSILAVLVLVLLSAMTATGNILRRTAGSIDAFQNARAAFDRISRNLSQATLNTYWEYDNNLRPVRYIRKSDLHFVCGKGLAGNVSWSHGVFFQSAATATSPADLRGLSDVLHENGFYIEFGSDREWRPPFLQQANTPEKFRYRLIELAGDPADFRVFRLGVGGGGQWAAEAIADGEVTPVASNVLALFAWPRLPVEEDPLGTALGATIAYDSRANWNMTPQPITAHQMPPLIELVMVAIDEASAARLSNGPGQPAGLANVFDRLFEDSGHERFEADFRELERRLAAFSPKLDFRIFRSVLPVRESKWNR